MTCNLSCVFESHYHCPYCGTVIKSVSQFENHLKKCDEETIDKDPKLKRKSRWIKMSHEYDNSSEGRKSDKVNMHTAKSMSEEDRKKHTEHVKAITGENYVSRLTFLQ